jgi:hypothetical protein
MHNSAGSLYYPDLVKRFNANDTSLDVTEYIVLYYGFAMRPEYDAAFNTSTTEVTKLLKARNFKAALAEANRLRSLEPYSLEYMNVWMGVVSRTEKAGEDHGYSEEQIEGVLDHFYGIAEAIYASGNGMTDSTGFVITSVGDEYAFVGNFLDVDEVKGQRLVNGTVDELAIAPSKKFPREKIYFDASFHFGRMSRVFGVE